MACFIFIFWNKISVGTIINPPPIPNKAVNKPTNKPCNTMFFLEARNILDENYETGGIFAENEVSGTGGSGTFVTPGQPFTIFGGINLNW